MRKLNYIYLNNRSKLLREETVEDVNNTNGPNFFPNEAIDR